MRIAIDVRPLQLDAYKERGIGSYLRGWIQAAQKLETSFHFTLLHEPALPPPLVRLESDKWQFQSLDLPFSPPPTAPSTLHFNPDQELQFDSALESFLLDSAFDFFHLTYSFMWEAFVGRRLYKTSWGTTFYDLIPLLFPQEYLAPLGMPARASFAERLGGAAYARRLHAISQATKNDLATVGSLSPDKIDVIYGGINPAFKPVSSETAGSVISALRIREPYALSVSGFHHTKNLYRLLEAFSLVRDELNELNQLVVVCPLTPPAREIVQGWMQKLGIADRVILLQGLNEHQMVCLYNRAALVVHPTLYEGFGLPILEAMRCGTPVVTSNVSSMVEIAEHAAELVDPSDSKDIARGMRRVLQSKMLQSELKEKGFAQAARYTWERTAVGMLGFYEKAIEESTRSHERFFPVASIPSRRLRLAYWSPVNPRLSGISDYSEALIAALSDHADIDLFVDGYQPSNLPLFDSFPTYDARAYPSIDHTFPYDLDLFQVGNNPLHAYMYKSILSSPGIITLHDFYLYHFIHSVFVKDGNSDGFWDEVAFCEGSEQGLRAKVAYVKRMLDDYELPLNKRLVLASEGIVVHSEWAAQALKRYPTTPPVEVIPFGISIFPDDGGRFQKVVRRHLEIPADAFVFGIFGNLHRVKRIPSALRAFARVRKHHSNAVLLLMGAADVTVNDLVHSFQQDLMAARAQGIFIHPEQVDCLQLMIAMQAVDVGINLRYPTAGETSASLSQLLGQGKPTIVSSVGSFAEYPDACCPKTPIDDDEENVLYQHMMNLMDNESRLRLASQAAFEFARDKTWAESARRYLNFAERILSQRTAHSKKK